MTDGRCLDFDPETEGSGLDKRPVYNIDGRVQEENLNSYLCVMTPRAVNCYLRNRTEMLDHPCPV